jgi:hypothetical protein
MKNVSASRAARTDDLVTRRRLALELELGALGILDAHGGDGEGVGLSALRFVEARAEAEVAHGDGLQRRVLVGVALDHGVEERVDEPDAFALHLDGLARARERGLAAHAVLILEHLEALEAEVHVVVAQDLPREAVDALTVRIEDHGRGSHAPILARRPPRFTHGILRR